MINEKQNKNISKFLSLVLRHKPETIGIKLDENGWVDVREIISKINDYGIKIDFEILNHVVETNNKKRFAFDSEKKKIRASQGHSIDVKLGYENQKPPEILYHGTAERFVESILKDGLQKRSRQHVHLSSELQTAINVGKRHGKPYIFEVLAGQMYQEEFEFYLSENGVWLTQVVPVKYLKKHR